MLNIPAEDSIGLVLVDTTRLLRTRMDRALETAGLGLTVGEARALAYAALKPAARRTALASGVYNELQCG